MMKKQTHPAVRDYFKKLAKRSWKVRMARLIEKGEAKTMETSPSEERSNKNEITNTRL